MSLEPRTGPGTQQVIKQYLQKEGKEGGKAQRTQSTSISERPSWREGVFGLGFEDCIGSLCMEREAVRGEDSSKGGLEEEHPEVGRWLWGSLCGLDPGNMQSLAHSLDTGNSKA